MFIAALRYRDTDGAAWTTWKFRPGAGTGRQRQIQLLQGAPEELHAVARALVNLLGPAGEDRPECQMQLVDDAGHTWLAHRTRGGLRLLKDGQEVPAAEAARRLSAVLLDLDEGAAEPPAAAAVCHGVISGPQGQALRIEYSGSGSASALVRGLAADRIRELCAEAGRLLGINGLGDPGVLLRITRRLEPLSRQLAETGRQLLAVQSETRDQADPGSMQKLTHELALIDDIAREAQPLLEPGVTVKGVREQLARLDAAIAETAAALGLDPAAPAATPARDCDFRKAIDALSRLEAQSRLVRAMQAARTWCERHAEPQWRRYHAETAAAAQRDRQVLGEIESCLATLSLRHAPRGRPDAASEQEQALAARKGWFDRFKQRQQSAEPADARPDLETDRMAVEFATGRLKDLLDQTLESQKSHARLLAGLDAALEEAIRDHGRMRERWLGLARAAGLPEDLDTDGLLAVARRHGDLIAMTAERGTTSERLADLSRRHARLERMVGDWRRATGSQKQTDLAHPQLLLQEAQAIIRYREPRQRLLDQMRERITAGSATLHLKNLLAARVRGLETEWAEALKTEHLPAFNPDHRAVPELYRRADLVRALALIQTDGTEDKALIAAGGAPALLSIYVWDELHAAPRAAAAFVEAVTAAAPAELRLLLVADEALAAQLQEAGVGGAQRLATAPAAAAKPAVEPATAAAKPETPGPGRQAPGALAPGTAAVGAAPQDRRQLLNAKAQKTLDLLKTNRNFMR